MENLAFMANHGNLDSLPPNDAIKHDHANDAADGKNGGLSALQADAGVFGPSGGQNAKIEKSDRSASSTVLKDHFREDYPIKASGTEEQFVRDEPGRARKHYGLDAKADSQTLFDRMSHDNFTIYKGSSHDMKAYVRHELGLPEGKTPLSEDQFIKAQQDSWRKSVGLDDTASAKELEDARNKQTYADVHKQMKDLKIDPN